MADSLPGGSLRAYRDFDDSIEVVGLDIDAETLFSEERIVTHQADQTNLERLCKLGSAYRSELNLLIDDGYHFLPANINSILAFFPNVVQGGYIVIEDIPKRRFHSYLVVSNILNKLEIVNYFWQDESGSYQLVIQKQ